MGLVGYLITLNYSKIQIKHDTCDGYLKRQLNDALSVVLDRLNVMGNERMHPQAQLYQPTYLRPFLDDMIKDECN